MLTFPNAKINLGLNVLGKRPDGYHNIQSCFYPVKWCDALEIIESDELSFHPSGLSIPGDSSDNLCVKAFDLLNKDFDIPPVAIYLHKVIPMGAGLGGGSADGSFMLKMLNEKFQLSLTDERLRNYASLLGSDCPFFISNQPVLVSETGTAMSSIDLSLDGLFITLVNPRIHISTKEAYQLVNYSDPVKDIKSILKREKLNTWKTYLMNDFELAYQERYPVISEIKNELYGSGALYAAMTGSGSTVFGIFEEEAGQLFEDQDFDVFTTKLD